ncbi:MAG: hypothetical protein U0S48_23350 [Solirubrobacteraceae bacterium]
MSGPARTPKGRGRGSATAATAARPPARAFAGGAVALPAPRRHVDRGLARRLGALVEHPWLDRLLTGRLWIAIVAVGLIGLVFMQVSLLKLNAGMGQDVERAEALGRQNAVLRADVSKQEAPDRIQQLALGAGMVLPAADQVTFLGRDGKRMSGAEKPAVGQASTATLPVTAAQAPAASTAAPASTVQTPTSTQAAPAPTAATPTPTTSTPAPTTATPTPTAAAPTQATAPAATTPPSATPTQSASTPTDTGTGTGGAVAGG